MVEDGIQERQHTPFNTNQEETEEDMTTRIPEANKVSNHDDKIEERNVQLEESYIKLESSKNGIYQQESASMMNFTCLELHAHPGRSLIMDPFDENDSLYNVFAKEKLNEIVMYNKKVTQNHQLILNYL
jgi:hypothetical protein